MNPPNSNPYSNQYSQGQPQPPQYYGQPQQPYPYVQNPQPHSQYQANPYAQPYPQNPTPSYNNNPERPPPPFQSKPNSSNSSSLHTKANLIPQGSAPAGTIAVVNRKYNDVWAAILYLISLLGFATCAYFGITSLKNSLNETNNKGKLVLNYSARDIIVLFGGSIILGFVLSFSYFMAMKKYAGKLIVVSFILNIVMSFAFAGFLFYIGAWVPAIFGLLFALLNVFFYFNWKPRFPFAKVMLKSVISVISDYPATITSGVIGLFVSMIFSAVWIASVGGISLSINASSNQGQSSNASNYVLLVFLLFTFYWTIQVIKNTVHVTVSGLFATYYFYGQSVGGKVTLSVQNPTSASAKRALTTSFGSICYGSLIIALIETLKVILKQQQQQAREDGNMLAMFCLMCATCILQLIEDIAEYFNHYAFTQVAIYGKDFCTAAKATWALIKSKGIDAIINDNLIGMVLGMGSLMVGIIGAGYGAIVVYTSQSLPKDLTCYIIVCLICFLVGISEFTVLAEVINSGVSTTFVCLAEDPSSLMRTKPELYQKIRSVYPQVGL